jgi:hypothetical protein
MARVNEIENEGIGQHSKYVGVCVQQLSFVEVFQHSSVDGLHPSMHKIDSCGIQHHYLIGGT